MGSINIQEVIVAPLKIASWISCTLKRWQCASLVCHWVAVHRYALCGARGAAEDQKYRDLTEFSPNSNICFENFVTAWNSVNVRFWLLDETLKGKSRTDGKFWNLRFLCNVPLILWIMLYVSKIFNIIVVLTLFPWYFIFTVKKIFALYMKNSAYYFW